MPFHPPPHTTINLPPCACMHRQAPGSYGPYPYYGGEGPVHACSHAEGPYYLPIILFNNLIIGPPMCPIGKEILKNA